MADRWGFPPLIRDVAQSKGIVISYSNEIDMEVTLNYSLPNGDKTVGCNVVSDESLIKSLPG